MSNISKISCFLIIIMLFNTACLKRIAVEPNSQKIPESDFVEVTLISGRKYTLTKVEVHEDYLEGDHRDERIQIKLAQIKNVEIVNKDYGKVLTYYLIGFGIAVALGIWLADLRGPLFD